MESSRQLLQLCIFIIVAFQMTFADNNWRTRLASNRISRLSGTSQCATKRCNIGTVCRVMQACTSCPQQAKCVSAGVAKSDEDDDCQMAGCGPAVLLGSSLAPRTMRCLPWSRTIPRGGCGVGASCVRTSSSRQAPGTCCTGQQTSSVSSTHVQIQAQIQAARRQAQVQAAAKQQARRQAVATLKARVQAGRARAQAQAQQQAQQQAQVQALNRQVVAQAQFSRDSRDFKDSRDSRDSRDQPDITIVNITPDNNKLFSLDSLNKVDSIDDSKLIQVNTYQPIVKTSYNVKIGSCPLRGSIFFNNCDNGGFQCADDVDCPDDLKCCDSSCGLNYCTVPDY